MSDRGWIGVDLDKCLAHHADGQSIHTIGAPIPRMVERVRLWLAEGREVRIMTARVAASGRFVPASGRFDDYRFRQEQEKLIGRWCQEHLGVRLRVTATKDAAMQALYDDRARTVLPNTGLVLGEDVSGFLDEQGNLR